jgi:hypothetical protein
VVDVVEVTQIVGGQMVNQVVQAVEVLGLVVLQEQEILPLLVHLREIQVVLAEVQIMVVVVEALREAVEYLGVVQVEQHKLMVPLLLNQQEEMVGHQLLGQNLLRQQIPVMVVKEPEGIML